MRREDPAMTDLIAAYLRHAAAAGLARSTTITDRGELLRRADAALRPYGLIGASTPELLGFLANPSWSRQTVSTYHGHLSAFYRWATIGDQPILDWSPMADVPRPRVPSRAPRPVTTAELQQALGRLANPWRRYVMLAAYAGLRACEIAGLRREDITAETITVQGKGGRLATVPTHPDIWTDVRDLPPGPIAVRHDGGRADPRYVSTHTARRLARVAGLPGVTLHRFRHWLGTTSLNARDQNGVRIGDLRKTQELLRHSSPAVTAIYTQVTDEERRAVIHALPTAIAAAA
jgi:integrase/recombinase XerD